MIAKIIRSGFYAVGSSPALPFILHAWNPCRADHISTVGHDDREPRTRLDGWLMERTTFQFAMEKGNNEIRNLLIEAGADVNEPPVPTNGATALQRATIKGYFGVTNDLLF